MQKPRVIPAARISRQDGTPSVRRLAAGVTAAAAVLALVLAAALPARAGSEMDLADHGFGADAVPVPLHIRDGKKGKTRVPETCALVFEGEERSVELYPESCLLDHGVTRRLPYRCGNDALIFGHEDVVFSARCLKDAGFVLPGRRHGY